MHTKKKHPGNNIGGEIHFSHFRRCLDEKQNGPQKNEIEKQIHESDSIHQTEFVLSRLRFYKIYFSPVPSSFFLYFLLRRSHSPSSDFVKFTLGISTPRHRPCVFRLRGFYIPARAPTCLSFPFCLFSSHLFLLLFEKSSCAAHKLFICAATMSSL